MDFALTREQKMYQPSNTRDPIFKIATFGIVGDLREIVPRLAEELRDQISG